MGLYYKRSLTSDRDKRLFEEYKPEYVGIYVASEELRCQIHNCVKFIPPAGLVSLIPIVKILPVDRVELLLTSKTPNKRETLLATIANDPDRGSWSDHQLSQIQLGAVHCSSFHP